MRRQDAGECADDLDGHVAGHIAPRQAALGRVGERDGWIEVRARDRPERQDEGDQRGARGERIRQQRDGDVPAGEALAHDAGADHGREQKGRAHRLGNEAAGQVRTIPPTHTGRGLRARTNALMNLPSTTGAMAAASIPSRSRNSRASSTR